MYAKQIGSSLYGRGLLRPIILGIALKDQTPETLKQVVQFISESDIFLWKGYEYRLEYIMICMKKNWKYLQSC